MSGREEMKEQIELLEDMVVENPCQMPDYALRGLAYFSKFFMKRFVMNRHQVAEYFGVSVKTIDRWREKHDFPRGEFNGERELSIEVDKIIKWKKEHKDVWC